MPARFLTSDAEPAVDVRRLTVADVAHARELFALVARVFDVVPDILGDAYLAGVLARDEFWAFSASADGRIVGGLTAHTLPLTRAEVREVFIYDIAVLPEFQRRGVGRTLVSALLTQSAAAGIAVAFVPADNDDQHALDFYTALGGVPSPVTIFTFGDDQAFSGSSAGDQE